MLTPLYTYAVIFLSQDYTGFPFFILLISPVVYWSVKYIYSRRNDHLWHQGIFPPDLSYSRNHLLEAYIYLAGRMVQADTDDAGKKLSYMSKYFQQHFPNADNNFKNSLTHAYRYPIKVRTVTYWLNKHLHRRDQKLQIMYFLAGLSMVDGKMRSSELFLLEEVNKLLQLTPKDFDSIIGMYQRYEYAKKEQEQTFFNEHETSDRKKQLIELCCKILGVSVHAGMDEIKKAYRLLVKIHHPDKFINESAEQQEIAEKRFLEIQKAYETLEKWK